MTPADEVRDIVGEFEHCTYMWETEDVVDWGGMKVPRDMSHMCGAMKNHDDSHVCRGCGEEKKQ